MSAAQATGLGEPDMTGRRALFRPPEASTEEHERTSKKESETWSKKTERTTRSQAKTGTQKRVRSTIELTAEALVILQTLQNQHRLQTGKSLPFWKALSQIIEFYGKAKGLNQ